VAMRKAVKRGVALPILRKTRVMHSPGSPFVGQQSGS
jgi:hypothetical protein